MVKTRTVDTYILELKAKNSKYVGTRRPAKKCRHILELEAKKCRYVGIGRSIRNSGYCWY
jgi:hypothetical protein